MVLCGVHGSVNSVGTPQAPLGIQHPPPASAQRTGRPTSRAEDGECPRCGSGSGGRRFQRAALQWGRTVFSTLWWVSLRGPAGAGTRRRALRGWRAGWGALAAGHLGPRVGLHESRAAPQPARPPDIGAPRGRRRAERGRGPERGAVVELLAAAWPVRRRLPWVARLGGGSGARPDSSVECSRAAYVQGARAPACRAGAARHCERQGLVQASVSRRVSSLHWTPGPWRKAVLRAPPLTRGEADAPQGLRQHRPRAEPSCCWPGPSRPAESRLQPGACGWFTQGGSPEEGAPGK